MECQDEIPPRKNSECHLMRDLFAWILVLWNLCCTVTLKDNIPSTESQDEGVPRCKLHGLRKEYTLAFPVADSLEPSRKASLSFSP